MPILDENASAQRAAKRAEAEASLRRMQLLLDELQDDAIEQRQQLADVTNAENRGAAGTPSSGSATETGAAAHSRGGGTGGASDLSRAAPGESGSIPQNPTTAHHSVGQSSGATQAGVRRSRSPENQDQDQPVTKKMRRSRQIPQDQRKSSDYNDIVISYGRRCALTCRLYLADRTFDPLVPLNPSDAPPDIQAETLQQIAIERADIKAIIQQSMHDDLLRKAFTIPFIDGMQDERHRLRGRIHEAAMHIVGPTWADYIARGELDCEEFREYIGFKKDGSEHSTIPYYDHDAPALHTFASSTYMNSKPGPAYTLLGIKTRFHNPLLKKVMIAVYRGVGALKTFNSGRLKTPAVCVQKMYNVTEVTPPMIALCATLYLFLLSPDVEFRDIGDKTGIDYKSNYNNYLSLISTGLARGKRSYVQLIKDWNEVLFPGRATTLGAKFGTLKTASAKSQAAMMDEISEDEDETSDNT